MSRDLLVVVPSRGRPENASRLIKAIHETCHGDTTLLLGLDSDDPTLAAYSEILAMDPFQVESQTEAHLRQVVSWINHLAFPRVDQYRFIGTIGDDNVPLTQGWDTRVIESLSKQKTGFCYADDCYALRPRGMLCTHIFMTSNIIKALGYMGPPQLKHMYVDNVWWEWGRSTSMEFLGDVNLQHLHHTNAGVEYDDTYKASDEVMVSDYKAFEHYQADPNGLAGDIDRIRSVSRETGVRQ